MKKIYIGFLSFIIALSFATMSYAEGGAMDRLQGGAKRLLKSPKQICKNIQEESEVSEFKPFGVFGGFLKGTFYTIKEAGTGLFEILTFPVDLEQ